MATVDKIAPCLWFDNEGLAAAEFYTSIFKNSKVLSVAYYGSAGPREEGMVMLVDFQLEGRTFTALNGGPDFTLSEAISLQVYCDSQAEVDDLWSKLTEEGEEAPCGWLKDKFGLSWQIVPRAFDTLMRDPDQAKAQRAIKAMLGMKKIDMAEIERAAVGG
jgi:predicted 3-demethylubiquinone-9 3-methyltransferase (glyoxalase superfamily)